MTYVKNQSWVELELHAVEAAADSIRAAEWVKLLQIGRGAARRMQAVSQRRSDRAGKSATTSSRDIEDSETSSAQVRMAMMMVVTTMVKMSP